MSSGWADVLTNGNFESPVAASNWTDTGWTASGDVWRAHNAAYHGERGARIPTAAAGEAVLCQDATVPTGAYTFCGWLRIGGDAQPTNLELRLEWKDADSNDVQAATVSEFSHLDRDRVWRHVGVSGTCSISTLSFVRAVLCCRHDAGGAGATDIGFDEAQLYGGTYTGVPFLVNGGFERGGYTDGEWWYGSQWSAAPESVANSRRTWWPYSGTYDGVLEGWVNGNHTSVFSQCIYPQTTGSWTFSLFLRQEVEFQLSNAHLRIEWRDATYTNKVQADTLLDLTVTNDNQWGLYRLTGSCADTNLFEVRAVAEFGYGKDALNRSMYLDAARLAPGGYTNTALLDGGYHNHYALDPLVELVPGGSNYGPFLQVNYATTTTTFYALGHHPGVGAYPDSDSAVGLYAAWQPPADTNWVTLYGGMTKVGTVTVKADDPFHGLPASGTMDLDVYRYEWKQPCDGGGVPYAAPVKVYYAMYFDSFYGSVQEDRQFLVRVGGTRTNDYPLYPQYAHTSQWDRDYFYYNLPHVPRAAFTNHGFEAPPPPVSTNAPWQDAGWQGYGDATRDDWSAHAGALGAYLPGWFTNWPAGGVTNIAFSEAGVFQPLSCTGGTRTFATWFRSDPFVQPNRLELRLEWYETSGRLVQADVKDLSRFPRDGSWHHAFVTGTCLSNGLSCVVPYALGQFWQRTGFPDRVQLDDADFYAGAYTGVYTLANTSFEEGNPFQFRGSRWYAQTEYLGNYRPDWGARRGTWCAAFDGGDTNATEFTTRISQNLTPGTGTYTFAIWMLRDTNFVMTNCEVRLEWYDATFTNRVQADSITNFIAPDDNVWREYYVTGTCGDPELYEVRATVMVQYDRSPGTNGTTCRIDDARFFEGDYVPALVLDWGYHGAGTNNALTEPVPGGWGTFLRVDYARTTTTFYVLADDATIAPDPQLTGVVGLRVTYLDPLIADWSEVQTGMTHVGTAELDAGDAFHGLPSAGTKTVAVYRYRWTQPLDAGGDPLTGQHTVYYCPYFRAFAQSNQVENLWLLATGEIENNYTDGPQLFGESYFHKDYRYTNDWTPDQDGDGILDLWEIRYFDEITDCDASADDDGDERSNGDEFIADSVPTNGASYFRDRIALMRGTHVSEVCVDEPTTNTRVYDAFWKTNVLGEGPWVPCGLDVPGADAGTNLWLSVTNEAEKVFYRAGVRVP